MKGWRTITTAMSVSVMLAVLVGACGGGGGGGDGLPRSSAAYAGSNMPALIDTTAYSPEFEDLLGDIELVEQLSKNGVRVTSLATGSTTMSNDFTYEGSMGGTRRNTMSMKTTIGEDAYENFLEVEEVYSSYADSGDQAPPGVLTGEGSFYQKMLQRSTFYPGSQDSLTGNGFLHINYDSLRITVGDYFGYTPFVESRDGYVTLRWMEDNAAGTREEIRTADISYAYTQSGLGPMTVGLLDASLTASYEGTATDVSTFAGTGTLCTEGDYEFSFYGCVDFVIDVSYEGDVTEPVDQPDHGTITVSTPDATAAYAFGTSESNPGCIEYSVIEAGASSAVFTTLVNCL